MPPKRKSGAQKGGGGKNQRKKPRVSVSPQPPAGAKGGNGGAKKSPRKGRKGASGRKQTASKKGKVSSDSDSDDYGMSEDEKQEVRRKMRSKDGWNQGDDDDPDGPTKMPPTAASAESRSPNNDEVSIDLQVLVQVLVLGASQPALGDGKSVGQIAELVCGGDLETMDGRDGARMSALAMGFGVEVYTVSQQNGDYCDRHLGGNFNDLRLIQGMKEQWGDVRFRQVILDYFWNPNGTWTGDHWKRSFVRDFLPRLVKEGLLDFGDLDDVKYDPELEAHVSAAGVVYLPFCERTLTLVVANEVELSKYFTISFVHKDDLGEHMLWDATNSISEEMMRDTFEKDIDQEERWCTLNKNKIRNGHGDDSVTWQKVEGVRSRIDRADGVRMIKLMAIRLLKWGPDCPESEREGKDELGWGIGGYVGLRPDPRQRRAPSRKRPLPQREVARPDEEGPRRKRAKKAPAAVRERRSRPVAEEASVAASEAEASKTKKPRKTQAGQKKKAASAKEQAKARRDELDVEEDEKSSAYEPTQGEAKAKKSSPRPACRSSSRARKETRNEAVPSRRSPRKASAAVDDEMGGAGGAPGPGAIEGAGSIPAPSTISVGASTAGALGLGAGAAPGPGAIAGAGGGGTLDAAPGEAGSPRQHVEAVELADEGADTNDGEEVGERPDEVVDVDGRLVDGGDDDVTEERLEGASDGAPAPPPPAKAAPTPSRPAHRRKKKGAGRVQLFAFHSPPESTDSTANSADVSTSGSAASDRRPKRKLKSIARYSDSNPHAKPPSNGEGYKHGEGFLCPRCGHVCSYDSRVCEECHLECCYEAGVGVVTLRERRASEPAKAGHRGDPGAKKAGRKEVDRSDGRGAENGAKRGVKRGSLKGRPPKTDGKTGENKAPTEDADVKDEETDTESASCKDASGEHRAVGAGEEETDSAGEKKPARKKSRARGGEPTATKSAPRARPRRSAAVKAAAKLSGDMSDEDSGSDGDSFALDEASLAGSADEYLEEEEYDSDSSGSSGKRPPKSNQRRGGNQRAPQKANKGNGHGGVFKSNDERWNEKFELLRDFKAEHGHCNVPRRDSTLGNWVTNQRRFHKRGELSGDRVSRLDEIGFQWTLAPRKPPPKKPNDELWNEKFEQLRAYKSEHRHCNVPWKYAENPQLGTWVSNQRSRYRNDNLLGERKERLDELGFQWEVDNHRFNADDGLWNERFEQLKAYSEEHGHCNVPQSYEVNGLKLGRWVMTQRYRQGKLSDERKRSLEEIGFQWAHFNDLWNERFKQLCAYRNEHGNCNVPPIYAQNPQLGSWVKTQRQFHRSGRLADERIRRLEKMGFQWTVKRGKYKEG